MNNDVQLKVDSRDRDAHIRFGATTDFASESNFGFDLFQVIEPEGDINCTAYSTTKSRSSQTKVQYDVNDLWKDIPHNQTGADPRDTIGKAIKNGLKYFNTDERDFGVKGYYRGDTGNLIDAFDNVRSAMTLNNSSTIINTYWYMEWSMTPIFGKMPIGKTKTSTHSYVIVDWKIIDGETVFLIDSHQGQKRYMPRETLNQALKEWGTSTLMPSTEEVLEKRNKAWYEAIGDIVKNLWIAVTRIGISIKQLPQPVPIQEPKSDYQEVKEAITMKPKYIWDTPEEARHSVRVICDEEGLSVQDKNDLCATVGAESGWKPGAIGKPNKDGSRDYGIIQLNDKYWIGKVKLFPTTDFVLENPEICIRWMCGNWVEHKKWWYGFTNGSYKKFL